jgi:hypothetical protein
MGYGKELVLHLISHISKERRGEGGERRGEERIQRLPIHFTRSPGPEIPEESDSFRTAAIAAASASASTGAGNAYLAIRAGHCS